MPRNTRQIKLKEMQRSILSFNWMDYLSKKIEAEEGKGRMEEIWISLEA